MTPTAVSWATARTLAHDAATPLAEEEVALEAALWRRTATDLRALTPLPPLDASAMDGWAVYGPGPWRVVGSAHAGAPPATPLAAGQALAVATGTALPPGADAVLRREDGLVDPGGWLRGAVAAGRDIRPAGEECGAGEVLVPAGSVLDPVRLGLVAAGGHDEVFVVRRPRVRVLVLGDELLQTGPARDGRVRDSLGPQLPGWLATWGCSLAGIRRVPDTLAAHVEAVVDRTDNADVIVTTGGTSLGPVDFVRRCVAETSGTMVVPAVDCRPGHPMLLARWADRWLVGLPGNPHAAVAALLTLLEPLLLGLGGAALSPLREVRLSGRVAARDAGIRLVPCRLVDGQARPARGIGSGMLRGLAEADGLAVVAGAADSGDRVGWLPLPWSRP